tara:strand:- start:23 stop:292 length:270 start_codon:yes stop_codon:yes gene_type:complete
MKPEEILKKAASLVSGDRAVQHGDYTLQHKRVADLWSAYLNTPITAQEVAFCMVLLKVSRDEVGSLNIDDGVDASAYTSIWAALAQKDA